MPPHTSLTNRPYHRIRHPHTGDDSFGTFPSILTKRYAFPEAPVYLLFGEHRGHHRGYGFRHIHAQRFSHIPQVQDAIKHVAAIVAEMIAPGSHIHCEFASVSQEVPLIVRLPNRVLVLEHRSKSSTNFYSVRTYYEEQIGGRKNKGPKIGAF